MDNHVTDETNAVVQEKKGFRYLLHSYTEGIQIIRDTLDVAWKFAPIPLVVPAAMLWAYLNKIGWSMLFSEAIASLSGLIVMIVVSCLFLLVVFVLFCIPSFITTMEAGLYEGNGQKTLARAVVRLHAFPPVVWILLFSLLELRTNLGFLGALISVVATLVCATGCVFVYRDIFFPIDPASGSRGGYAKTGHWALATAILKTSFLPTVASVAITVPLAMCLTLVRGVSVTDLQALFILIGLGLLSMVGMSPGLAYLREKVSGKSTLHASKMATVLGLGVAYLVISGALYFAPVSTSLLRMTGVLDERPHVYQIVKPELVATMRAIGITVISVSERADKQPASYFAYAYTRFNFNGVLLLCRDSFKFSHADITAWDSSQVDRAKELWLEAGNFCVKAHGDDLRPLQRRHLE